MTIKYAKHKFYITNTQIFHNVDDKIMIRYFKRFHLLGSFKIQIYSYNQSCSDEYYQAKVQTK